MHSTPLPLISYIGIMTVELKLLPQEEGKNWFLQNSRWLVHCFPPFLWVTSRRTSRRLNFVILISLSPVFSPPPPPPSSLMYTRLCNFHFYAITGVRCLCFKLDFPELAACEVEILLGQWKKKISKKG